MAKRSTLFGYSEEKPKGGATAVSRYNGDGRGNAAAAGTVVANDNNDDDEFAYLPWPSDDVLPVCEILDRRAERACSSVPKDDEFAYLPWPSDDVLPLCKIVERPAKRACSAVPKKSPSTQQTMTSQATRSSNPICDNKSHQDCRPLFTKEAFLSKRIFHLKSYSKKRDSFGPFIAAGGATIRDAAVYPTYAKLVASSATTEEVDKAMEETFENSRARAMRLWHREVRVGDFILIRHQKQGPLTPARLFDETDNFIGRVYALGVVTAVPSIDCEDIREAVLQNFRRQRGWKKEENDIHSTTTFCRVSFLKMGFISSLNQETDRHLGLVGHPLINHVCQPGMNVNKKPLESESAQSMRMDLWENATIPIIPSEFGPKQRNGYLGPKKRGVKLEPDNRVPPAEKKLEDIIPELVSGDFSLFSNQWK